VDPLFLQQDDGKEDDFRLLGERPDNFNDAVEFDFLLGLSDVVLLDGVGLVALGEFACGPE